MISEARLGGDGVAIADVTLWEIAMLVTRGRVKLPHSLGAFLRHLEETFHILPVNGDIAERSMLFTESYPKDPTDRIIGAIALAHGIPLVTADSKILASKEVPCIW